MRQILLISFILIGSLQSISQDENTQVVRGLVVDSLGDPVENARIEIAPRSGIAARCVTNALGEFACEGGLSGPVSIVVTARGFETVRKEYNDPADLVAKLRFILAPTSIRTNVVVTTNRTETLLTDTPASVASLAAERIKSSGSPAIDDALRQTVGFTLFRRSNSRNANPTTQGTSLRGINASGASRTRVSFDGEPLNDPFGGWIQWSRVAPVAVERIEVMRGGSSSLYGSGSLGGAINVIPRRLPGDKKYYASAEIFGGSQHSYSGSTFFGTRLADFTADFVAGTFQTRGYQIVDEDERGSVDDFANSRNANYSGRLGWDTGDIGAFVKASYFGEARNNGTPVQKNRTHLRRFAAGLDFDLSNAFSQGSSGITKLRLRADGGTQVFDQKFSAVAADRNSEFLVRFQRVPAQVFGASALFSTVISSHTLLGGFEMREVRGSSNETGFFGGNATSRLGTGGRERTYGIYFQDFASIGERIVLVGNLRYDSWRNSRALSSTLRISTNVTTTTVFPDREQSAFSPSGAVLVRATDEVSFYFNASRSFRAPTLNELFRGFRVGSVITDPNENLVAEKANNFEGGASFGSRNIYIRANLYWTDVSDAISNVTVNPTPTLIFRERQNAGTIRVRGVEIEAEARIKEFELGFGYLLSDAEFADFQANPAIEGFRIPQVPLHQFTFQARFRNQAGWSFSVQGRAASEQFDDDLNTLRLEPYFQLDVFAAKSFKEKWQVFVGVENLFNSRYSVGRTPLRRVSSPISGRIGLRWN